MSGSLLGPCYWQTEQAVPIKRAQGGLLWQQLLWCAAVLSVCLLSLCVCVCVLLSPGRAGQTGPVHMEPAPLVSFVVALGVFPIGAWLVQYHAASSHSSSRISASLFLFCLSLMHFSLLHVFPPYRPYLQPSVSPSCLLNLPFFLLVFSEPFSASTVSLALPSLSVCLHSSSIRMDLVGYS